MVESSTEEDFTLTNDQKSNLIFAWRNSPKDKPPSIKELVEIAFPDKGYDARYTAGKVVRDFLATHQVFPKTNVIQKIGPYELNEGEKHFIQTNTSGGVRPLEITRVLFSNEKLTPLSREFKAVHRYISSLSFAPSSQNDKSPVNKTPFFEPPKNYTESLKLVNKYTKDSVDARDPSEKDKQGVNMLIKYLHSPRFVQMINTYKKEDNRELFLSEFVRATYDKPDLTADETNLYVNLSADYLLGSIALAERESLSKMMEEELLDGKLSKTTVEMIDAKNREYEQCLQRQKQLIKDLNGTRGARLAKQLQANSSILSLVEYWKDEKKRKKMIHVAGIREKARQDNVQNLNSMESIKAEIFGALEEDIY